MSSHITKQSSYWLKLIIAKIDFLILDGARRELLQVLPSSPPCSCRHSLSRVPFFWRGGWRSTSKFNDGKKLYIFLPRYLFFKINYHIWYAVATTLKKLNILWIWVELRFYLSCFRLTCLSVNRGHPLTALPRLTSEIWGHHLLGVLPTD